MANMHTEKMVTSLLRTAVDERRGSGCAITESVEVIIASVLSFVIDDISPKCVLDNRTWKNAYSDRGTKIRERQH